MKTATKFLSGWSCQLNNWVLEAFLWVDKSPPVKFHVAK